MKYSTLTPANDGESWYTIHPPDGAATHDGRDIFMGAPTDRRHASRQAGRQPQLRQKRPHASVTLGPTTRAHTYARHKKKTTPPAFLLLHVVVLVQRRDRQQPRLRRGIMQRAAPAVNQKQGTCSR
ncbi:hypothetical protein JDV02_009044 [Purpureocillium takamizusanense]|uniref:Uncharacterized protein n=1 Tax=Purpureocillium takamizusanense TaxID=2060973 RepID=A0A9Q8QRL5_9HYPO|nr:uncharacterized protein JDV02_009044 [Purpureocillium takamizusanense]UNI23212.1 hypothetical protein JDV02_009044 [Purpureocillium takamizusanense]